MRKITLPLLMVFISGCAGIEYKTIPQKPLLLETSGEYKNTSDYNKNTRIENLSADKLNEGIRYLDNSPYLLIYSGGDGKIVSQIIYLPDPYKLRSVKPYNNMASITADLEFDPIKGMKKHDEKVDATTTVKPFFSALKAAVPKLIDPTLNDPNKRISIDYQAPYLYKIVATKQGWMFIGGQGKPQTVKVNIDPQEVAAKQNKKNSEEKK